jgi:hypothetical protein
MEYKGYIADVIASKDQVRAKRRHISFFAVLLTVPLIVGFQKVGIVASPSSHYSTLASFVLFPIGWFIVWFAVQAVAMMRFVQFLRLKIWDSILFDRFYGNDIAAWAAFACYYGTLIVLGIIYGVSTVISNVRLLGALVFGASILGMLATLVLTRIIFAGVLLKAATR